MQVRAQMHTHVRERMHTLRQDHLQNIIGKLERKR